MIKKIDYIIRLKNKKDELDLCSENLYLYGFKIKIGEIDIKLSIDDYQQVKNILEKHVSSNRKFINGEFYDVEEAVNKLLDGYKEII